MVTANLALRFFLELAGLAAAARVGFQLVDGTGRWVVVVAAPAAIAVFWALVVAPHAANGFSAATRELIGSGVLLLAAGALALVGHPRLALVFAGLIVANTAGLVWPGHPTPAGGLR